MILETALMCMAVNLYHEAGNQSMIGQMAVGQVVLNRVADDRFPNTVCEVVKQSVTYKNSNKPVRWKCQFTWYCDGKKDEPNFESRTWRLALDHASILITKRIVLDITEGATHYHATYVRPAWAKTKTRTTRIDRHIFYRWEK
jgi:spore germination cell wall hydrolase CwlJ-like protein|tara:strand:- start:2578 stop:3006 length:429 start_codon:yes stop_codon:yes gene_type:complete